MGFSKDTAIRLIGDKELEQLFKNVPLSVKKQTMASAARKGGQVLRKSAKRYAQSVSKNVARSLIVKVKRTRNGAYALVGVDTNYVGDDGTRPSRILHLLEFGTSAHLVTGKGQVLANKKGEVFARANQRGKPFVKHPGARPRPIMRPAFDASKNQVEATYIRALQTDLPKFVAKYKKRKHR